MSVDPIGSPKSVSGLDSVKQLAGKPVERAADDLGGVDRDHDGDGMAPSAASTLRPYLAAGRTTSAGREERIASLRAAIAQGTYQVPVDTLAKKLLGNGH